MKTISPAALLAIFAFLYIAIVIPPAIISQKPAAQAVTNGQRIFNQSCAACHDTLGATIQFRWNAFEQRRNLCYSHIFLLSYFL